MSVQRRSHKLSVVSRPSVASRVALLVLTWRARHMRHTSYVAFYFPYYGGVSSRCFALGGL
jgi:hypothetical protein